MVSFDVGMKIYCGIIMYCAFIFMAGSWIGSVIAAIILRKKFPELWNKLGSPTYWIYGNVTSVTWSFEAGSNVDSHFFTFLEKKKFIETENKPFIAYCKLLRIGWYTGLGLFLLMFLTVAPYLVYIKKRGTDLFIAH